MRNLELYRQLRPSLGRSALWNMLSNVDSFFDGADSESEKPDDGIFAPRANIEETKTSYLIEFDVPGVKKEDLKIDLHGRTLTVSGERKRETKSEDSVGFQRYESFAGRFSRSFTLPEGVDEKAVEAAMTDGVLRVTVPKLEDEQPHTIAVK